MENYEKGTSRTSGEDPADWSNRILAKHRAKTQASKVGIQKHWSDIKNGETQSNFLLRLCWTDQRQDRGQGRAWLKRELKRTCLKWGQEVFVTGWPLDETLSAYYLVHGLLYPRVVLSREDWRWNPIGHLQVSYVARQSTRTRRNSNVLPLPNLINNPSKNEPKAKLGIGYVFRPSESFLDSTST